MKILKYDIIRYERTDVMNYKINMKCELKNVSETLKDKQSSFDSAFDSFVSSLYSSVTSLTFVFPDNSLVSANSDMDLAVLSIKEINHFQIYHMLDFIRIVIF